MAAAKKFTDSQLKQYLAMDFTAAEIARLFHVTEAAVSKRIAKLERVAVVRLPAVASAAQASVFDTRAALEENYRGCIALLSDPDAFVDKVAVRNTLLRHIEAGLKVVEKLYQFTEMQSFQEEVLTILEQMEPGVRRRALERLQQRRSVRAAFSPV